MVGVPLTQTEALQQRWPIWTQTQTNVNPVASERLVVWITRCKTFSSDLSLIEDAWFRFVFVFVSYISLCCVWHWERGRETVRAHLGGSRRGVSLPLKAFPSFCLRGKIETWVDSSGWLLLLLWEKDSGMVSAAGKFSWIKDASEKDKHSWTMVTEHW